jgi:hypothetical protein
MRRRAQTRKILGVKSAKRRFDRWTDADNSFFDARTQERNPKVTAKEQSRPARRRRTAGICRAVKLQPFHCRHRWIENIVRICSAPVLFHFTIKTRNSPSLDVSFTQKRNVAIAFQSGEELDLPLN